MIVEIAHLYNIYIYMYATRFKCPSCSRILQLLVSSVHSACKLGLSCQRQALGSWNRKCLQLPLHLGQPSLKLIHCGTLRT